MYCTIRCVALAFVAGVMVAGCSDDPANPTAASPVATFKKSTAELPAFPGADGFVDEITNPYLSFEKGKVFRYENETDEGLEETVDEVTNLHKTVLDIKVTVVHDQVFLNDDLIEDTYDWYAQDKDGAVWYFGEATTAHRRDGSTSTAGSWEAGVNGAQPGIIMPANPKPGEPYRQEYFKGHAEDMGQIVAVDESAKVPAGAYSDCVKTKDWSMIEGGQEFKWYARGVGFVRSQDGDEVAELVSVSRGR